MRTDHGRQGAAPDVGGEIIARCQLLVSGVRHVGIDDAFQVGRRQKRGELGQQAFER